MLSGTYALGCQGHAPNLRISYIRLLEIVVIHLIVTEENPHGLPSTYLHNCNSVHTSFPKVSDCKVPVGMKAQVLDANSFAGTFEGVTNTLDLKHPTVDSARIFTSSLEDPVHLLAELNLLPANQWENAFNED